MNRSVPAETAEHARVCLYGAESDKPYQMKTKIYRQGDVLIERINAIPATAIKQKPQGRIILAHGEATGHHHSLDMDAADWWKNDGESEQFLDVKTPTEVVHQEHSPIALKRGKYRITRQREYSPAAIRNVAD